jgi:hypothetical protein
VTGTHGALRRSKPLWLLAWPLWILLVFASLAAVRLLPGGPARAAVAAPILLVVPGSLTLGAIFSRRGRPRGIVFICYAVLLSAVWSGFASLALYVSGVPITAANTYGCLLIISTVLAVVAESRLVFGGPGTGRRAADQAEALDPDLSDAEVSDATMPAVARRGRGAYYGVLAVVAGASLLVGGLYAYEHLPHPAPVGYTWIAWTGPQIKGDIAIGSAGSPLHFQIVHHQPGRTAFRLSAAWLGSTSQPMAKPLTLSIGPDQTFHGAVFIPPLPNGCIYRIVVALTAVRQIDPLTKKPQIWSINADVQDPGKSSRTCKR